MNKFFLIFLFSFYLINSSVFGSGYYADIVVDVSEDGQVDISGVTNYEPLNNVLNSQEFTSKKKEYWFFNLTTEEVFDEYVFELKLPEFAQVNYVKAPSNFRIVSDEDRVSIIGVAEGESLSLVVQYRIDNTGFFFNKDFIIILLSCLLFGMSVLSIYFFLKIKKGKAGIKENKNQEVSMKKYDINNFTQRQQEIIKLLEVNKRLTQKEIEKIMNIPKSSVSRNVKTLEIKSIIVKEKIGQTNYLFLKDNV